MSSTFVEDHIQVKGEPDQNITYTIHLQTVSPRQNYITLKLEVKLLDCPPGFILKDEEGICNAEAYVALIRCHSFHNYLLPGYWAGQVETPNGLELATSVCLFCDYCMIKISGGWGSLALRYC